LYSGPALADDPWEQFAPPPDDKFDWIQLDSGEWLKGEIMSAYGDTIEFDSDKLGLLEFDFADVIQLRTSGSKQVKLEASQNEFKVMTGQLVIKENEAQLYQEGKTIELERDQLVSIAEDAHRERDYWRGSISVGATARGGNTETLDLTTTAHLNRSTALTRLILDYRGYYSESRVGGREAGFNNVTADRQRLKGSFDWLYTNRFYWQLVGAEYYRDPFTNIANQYSLWTGVGYDLISNSKTDLSVNTGLGYQETTFDSPPAGSDDGSASLFGNIGVGLEHELTSRLDLLYNYQARFLSEESGEYTHHMITTLSIELFNDFDLDISAIWDRIENPTPIEKTNAEGDTIITLPEKDDYQLVFGVAYDF
jgi:hypothetical protein